MEHELNELCILVLFLSASSAFSAVYLLFAWGTPNVVG